MSMRIDAGLSVFAAIAIIAFCTQGGRAAMASENSTKGADTPDLLLVVKRHFEHREATGLIGLVTEVKNGIATFVTCNGPIKKYKEEDLKETVFDCGDSASPDTNPMAGNCSDYRGAWNSVALVDNAVSAAMPGETGAYFAIKGDTSFEKAPLEQVEVAAFLDMVAVVKNCGNLLTGFDKTGKPILNFHSGWITDTGDPKPQQ